MDQQENNQNRNSELYKQYAILQAAMARLIDNEINTLQGDDKKVAETMKTIVLSNPAILLELITPLERIDDLYVEEKIALTKFLHGIDSYDKLDATANHAKNLVNKPC